MTFAFLLNLKLNVCWFVYKKGIFEYYNVNTVNEISESLNAIFIQENLEYIFKIYIKWFTLNEFYVCLFIIHAQAYSSYTTRIIF